ncbi:translation initiation factor IF-3 [candidate division WWE3 bacterium CG10_big_fil_rev_8_21_14_0_10_32_10]|uniref:Translation initiation factor IF-3 n=1 Tax=candidate division WWE3 bacterium CG10_big_fil_rev_8_21_14_0_10_32_10 TaxID=1975090 RepID=A0A2H0RBF8_UNCKA|nr:MAG: translation initiation factor IF-3 [candidate division WWE3 bacterium CG10_big_fil_rev_8_21_14_0_10_32_10]
MAKRERYIINEQIRGDEVRVIKTNENLGVISTKKALEIAKSEGKDLVLIAPQAKPPVCKIVELSKYKYQLQQKAQKAKAKSKQQELKEFRLGISTGDHDINIRVERARKFLRRKDKVKFTLSYKGREIIHKELGFEKMKTVLESLADVGTPESYPKLNGKYLEVTLQPK